MPLWKNLMDYLFITDNELEASYRVQLNDSSRTNNNPLKALVKKVTLVLSGGSSEFLPPEDDLEMIETAYATDSYVRQGLDKYQDKMFKSGWKFVGKNPASVDYVRTRFDYMAMVTQIPTDQLFMEFADDMVKFSNAILVKSRMTDKNQLPPNITANGHTDKNPIVGYFPVNVATMRVKRDSYGLIQEWQQEVAGQDEILTFKPQDVIHGYYKRKKGNAFGTPLLTPVLDDVRALRQAEDSTLKMLHRNINPFYHIKVGSEEYPADDAEIDSAKDEVEGMSVDGGLVTSERWEIKAIASNQVIDANAYLKYFEDRVFSGLSVPATMFGRGATANKSTSENQSAEFIDRVKAYQRIIESDINEFMLREILIEGGFDPIANPDDMVYYRFNEIDIDTQVKLENHAVYKYEHNTITEDEMRQLMGLDILKDRSKLHSSLMSGGSATSADTDNKVNPQNQHQPNGKGTSKAKDERHDTWLAHMQSLNASIQAYCHDASMSHMQRILHVKIAIEREEALLADLWKEDNCADQEHLKHVFKRLKQELVNDFLLVQEDGHYSTELIDTVFNLIESTIIHYLEKEQTYAE